MQDAISTKLVQIVTAIKDPSDNTPAFGQVYDYDPGIDKYDSWPAALILPSDQPGDYSTNKENDRNEGFMVYIMLPIGEPDSNQPDPDDEVYSRQERYQTMRMLSDWVRNAIDETQDLDGLRANGGADRVMGVEPASAGWDIVETNAGNTIMVRINVNVRYTHNYR